MLCAVAPEFAMLAELSGGLSIDEANRRYVPSLPVCGYTDDVLAARDRPIQFSDITGPAMLAFLPDKKKNFLEA